MVFSVLLASKILGTVIILILVGCASQPVPMSAPPPPPIPMSIPPKPFKICPENPKDDDQPCTIIGPTNVPSIRGKLINSDLIIGLNIK